MTIDPGARALHLRWLAELTQIPTVAGKEQRVIRWVEHWCAERPAIALSRDPAGNLTLSMHGVAPSDRPVYFTGHLDHPAFVVERILGPAAVQLAFRGGVMDDYFRQAKVRAWTADGRPIEGVLAGQVEAQGPHKNYVCELDGPSSALAVGDVAVWSLPPAEVIGEEFHTHACDDLAAVAGALAAFDVLLGLRAEGQPIPDVRVLLTRAEEIGFIGAIAAIKHATMPRGARVIALENSRSFPADSPIGGGPIVRVGDRISIFSPSLTAAIAKRAEELAGGPATPRANQKLAELPKWKWQRKLMAGGACEATVFCHAGYEATCVCLPLGNYHNMADLAAVQAGTNTAPPVIGREYIGIADYHAMVDLLVACGQRLPDAAGPGELIEKLWNQGKDVL